jgi:hypothetical protein
MHRQKRWAVLAVAIALGALTIHSLTGLSKSRAQTTSREFVTCTGWWDVGSGTSTADCTTVGGPHFTVMPHNKYLVITDVTVSPAPTVSGVPASPKYAVVFSNGKDAYNLPREFMVSNLAGVGAQHSYRSPPLVVRPATSLMARTWFYTNLPGHYTVSGILMSDPNELTYD